MVEVKYGMPSGDYPLGYGANPPLQFFLDSAGELTPQSVTSTVATYKFESGFLFRIKGSGFTKDASGDLSDTGTITSIELVSDDGKTVLQTLKFSMAADTFGDAVAAYGQSGALAAWLFNKSDTFTGSTGDDEIYGYGGNDIINAGAGDYDYVEGGEGKDTYDGGAGNGDQLSFQDAYWNSNAYRGINLDATKGTVIDPWGNSETFKNFESFRGSQFADVFVGSARDEEFMGLGGKDTIDGGGGFDTVRYHRDDRRGGETGIKADLSKGTIIDSWGNTDTVKNIEGVRGSQFSDTIIGNSAANRLAGEAGNDVISGGLGNDWLRGDGGKDAFLFNTTLSASNNVDTISNFVVADDTIRLENAIFTKLTGLGTLTADQFVKNASGTAADASDRIIYETDTGKIFYDPDGTGAAAKILFATLDTKPVLTAADFFIV